MNKKLRQTDVCDKCNAKYEIEKIVNYIKGGYYIIKVKCSKCNKEGYFQRRYKRRED